MQSFGAVKKLIVLGVLFVMAFSLFACTKDYEYKEGDFSLTIEVDKTEAHVGDTVTVTATFKNLSGRDLRIEMDHTSYKKLEDMILVDLFSGGSTHGFVVTSLAGPLKKMTLKKNTVITRTASLRTYEAGEYDVVSLVAFSAGKGYRTKVAIYSENIKVIVSEV